MEHILFEVQLCIEMLIFKEKHVFDILINLCLMTSLQYGSTGQPIMLERFALLFEVFLRDHVACDTVQLG